MIAHAVTAVMILGVCILGMFTPIEVSTFGGALIVDAPALHPEGRGHVRLQVNGLIIGGYSGHEFGHFLQQEERGDIAYYVTVAIPSVTVNIVGAAVFALTGDPIRIDYYQLPWERDAIIRGMTFEYQNKGMFIKWE